METVAQRQMRVARLEASREARRAGRPAADIGTVWPTPDDAGLGGITPVEIAPGRGDLDVMSGFYPTFPTALSMVGRTVSFARLFMSQPWVAAAVMRMLTWAIRVPLKTYRRMGDDPADRVELHPGEHPVATAAAAPWHGGSQADLVMSMLGPVLVHGNSVLQIMQSDRGDKLEYKVRDWRFCRPIMPFRDTINGWSFDYDQPAYKTEASADSVLHSRYWSPTGPIGVSPLQQLGVTLQIEDAAQRFQRGLWANGARPPNALVASPEFLGLEPAERRLIMAQLRKDVNNLYVGPENAGRPMLLPPGLDVKAAGQTTVEAALIDQRKIAREEIAGVYLIPPPLLGILERATYSNIEVQRDMTYTDCLGPPLILMEQSMNAQIVRDLLQQPDVYHEFDFGAVLRGDPLQQIELLRQAVGTALMTPNEGRSVLRLKKSSAPEMNEFYVPANNMQPIGSPPNPNAPLPPSDSGIPIPPDPQRGKRLHVRSRDRDYEKEMELV